MCESLRKIGTSLWLQKLTLVAWWSRFQQAAFLGPQGLDRTCQSLCPHPTRVTPLPMMNKPMELDAGIDSDRDIIRSGRDYVRKQRLSQAKQLRHSFVAWRDRNDHYNFWTFISVFNHRIEDQWAFTESQGRSTMSIAAIYRLSKRFSSTDVRDSRSLFLHYVQLWGGSE